MFPTDQEWKCVKIDDRAVYLSYGGRETRRIAQQHGTQVLMQPDTCFLMREQELGILHVGSSWTRGAAWPFLAKSTRADAVVVPFDIGDNQKLPDLVWIIPIGYLPTETLQEWQRLLDIQHGTGLRCMLEFGNSTHFWFKSMSVDCMIAVVLHAMDRNIPMVVTLTADQH